MCHWLLESLFQQKKNTEQQIRAVLHERLNMKFNHYETHFLLVLLVVGFFLHSILFSLRGFKRTFKTRFPMKVDRQIVPSIEFLPLRFGLSESCCNQSKLSHEHLLFQFFTQLQQATRITQTTNEILRCTCFKRAPTPVNSNKIN